MDLKKVMLSLGIAILFALFIVFAIDAIYQAPKYENYCSQFNYPQAIKAVAPNITCPILDNAQINNECYKNKGEIRYNYSSSTGCATEMYCDMCSAGFNNDNDKYNLNIFYLAAVIGLIAILIGLFIPLYIEEIASGLMLGGVFTLFQGTVRGFVSLGRYSKPLVLGVELVLLILIAYKKTKDSLNKKKKR